MLVGFNEISEEEKIEKRISFQKTAMALVCAQYRHVINMCNCVKNTHMYTTSTTKSSRRRAKTTQKAAS